MLKILLGAAALTFAAPTLAQPMPATDPHAGHAQHGQESHDQHGPTGHAQHGHTGERQQQQHHSGHGSHAASHHEHATDCCKDCCDQDGLEGAKMPCCAKHGGAPEGAADHTQHGN